MSSSSTRSTNAKWVNNPFRCQPLAPKECIISTPLSPHIGLTSSLMMMVVHLLGSSFLYACHICVHKTGAKQKVSLKTQQGKQIISTKNSSLEFRVEEKQYTHSRKDLEQLSLYCMSIPTLLNCQLFLALLSFGKTRKEFAVINVIINSSMIFKKNLMFSTIP